MGERDFNKAVPSIYDAGEVWWRDKGRFFDPDTSDVPLEDKQREIQVNAFVAGARHLYEAHLLAGGDPSLPPDARARAEIARLEGERRSDALAGQAALDETNNEIVRLRGEITEERLNTEVAADIVRDLRRELEEARAQRVIGYEDAKGAWEALCFDRDTMPPQTIKEAVRVARLSLEAALHAMEARSPQRDSVVLPTPAPCPTCTTMPPQPSWRWASDCWQHKCPNGDANAGHFTMPVERRVRQTEPFIDTDTGVFHYARVHADSQYATHVPDRRKPKEGAE